MKNTKKLFIILAVSMLICLIFATNALADFEEEVATETEITNEITKDIPAPAGESASEEAIPEAVDDGDFSEETVPEENLEAMGYISFDGEYRLSLGESAELAEILDSLGIDASEGIDAVTCSDPEAIVFEQDGNGCTLISTGKPFIDEMLYVTSGGTEYAIALHDPTEVADFSALKTYMEAEFETEIKLTADIDLSQTIGVHGTKTLDLSGHTLKAVGDDISIFALYNSNTGLKVIDSSREKTGKIDGNGKNATIKNPGHLTLSGITVTGINAGNSSPIYNDIGTLVIEGCTFSNCTGNYGGVVRNNSTAIISDSTFTGCSAENGGAVYCDGGDLTVTDCVFTGCTATEAGGAIAVESIQSGMATVTITDSTFTGCTANYGGAIFISKATVTLSSSTITGCSATLENGGGAIYHGNGSLSLIVESDKSMRIFGNTSGAKENNVYIGTAATKVICPTFSDGTRIGFSGAVMVSYSDGYNGIDEWLEEGTGMFFADDPAMKLEHTSDKTVFISKPDTESGIKIRPQTDDRLTYGDTASKIMYTVSVINDDRTPILSSIDGYDLELTGANGNYLLTLSLSSAVSAGNHVLRDVVTFSEGTLQNQSVLKYTVVPKELGISWTDGTLTYSGEAQLPGYELNGVLEGDDCAVEIADAQGKTLTAVDVGSYTAYAKKLTGTSNENYKLPADGLSKEFTISPKEVTLHWGTAEFIYNGKKQAPSVMIEGFITGDNVDIEVNGAAADAGTYSGSSAAKAVLTGGKAGNYTLPENSTCDFIIGRKQLAVTGTAAEDKTYDGTTAATFSNAGKLVGLADGDIVTLGTSGSFDDATVGGGKSVTVYYTVSGDAMKNYFAPSDDVVTAAINPKPVTLHWGTAEFIYNGKMQAPSVMIEGFISGDDVDIEIRGAAKDSGTYSGSKAAQAVLTGNNADNYALPENDECDFVILKKQLTVENTVAADKTYDGTTAAAFSNAGNLIGLADGDSVTLNVSGTFDNANAGAGKTVTVNYSISGETAKNYLAPAEKTVTASIKPMLLGDNAIGPISAMTYTGSELTPEVIVSDGSSTLTSGTDYSVSYSNNVEPGTATVTVTFCHNYTGTGIGQFTIEKYNGNKLTAKVIGTETHTVKTAPVVTTTDEDRTADFRVVGKVAEIVVKDANGKPVSPDNVTIVSLAALIAKGAKTAEIRMSDTLTVEIDLEALMGDRKDCTITIDNADGTIIVKCDDETVFEADLTDIADSIARLVYDGKTVKALDEDGRIIAEFELSDDRQQLT